MPALPEVEYIETARRAVIALMDSLRGQYGKFIETSPRETRLIENPIGRLVN